MGAPGGACGAGLGRRLRQLFATRLPSQAARVDSKEPSRGSRPFLPESLAFWIKYRSAVVALPHKGQESTHAESPLHFARPSLLEPRRLVPGDGRRGARVGQPAGEV